jgi:hypothetical protein
MPTQRKHATSGRPLAAVTGASSGIGEAFATRLAHDQHDLIVVARSRERLAELAERLHRAHHVDVEVLAADLTERSGLERLERRLAGEDRLELLVNNAGFGTVGAFAKAEVEHEEEEIRLNVLALVRLTRAALPGMIARKRGTIINVSSMAAFQPGPYMATYGATKAFVNSFTEGVAEELRGTGVKIQALCPGFTRTEFQERANVNTSSIPSFAWMTAEAVVDSSLRNLRWGEVVCVPGLGNWAFSTLTAAVPRAALRRVSGMLGKRLEPARG